MRGVILAGGSGSRLSPLTLVTNKHLLPVGKEPMIYHPVRKLVHAGIEEILIVTGTEHAGSIFQLLGSGKGFGSSFTFRVQDAAGGIAHALALARDFVRSDPFVVILGDNIFESEIRNYCSRFYEYAQERLRGAKSSCGMVLVVEVEDAHRYGVLVVDNGKTRIIEKPPIPSPSNLAVTGIYFYQGEEIFDIIKGLRPSGRGELEITDLNNELLRRGCLLHEQIDGWWTDAGTFESLTKANLLLGS